MIVGLFPELASPGGVQRAGRLTAAAIASFADQRREQCLFLSLNDPPNKSPLPLGSQQIVFHGFDRFKVLFLKSAWLAARKELSFIAAFHPNLAPVAAALKVRNPAARMAVFAHGIEVWNPLPLLRRRALLFSDAIFAPSADTARHVALDQGVPAPKVVTLPWSLGPEFTGQIPSPKHPLPPGFPSGKIILTVGRWEAGEAYKGADHLIQALPLLLGEFMDLQLVLVGSGTDVPRLQSIARNLNVDGHVRFLHALTNQELSAAYQACDVFALPSRGEGFGLVFLEAMSHGKPVIGGAHGGATDIIADGADGFLVPYGDVPKLAEKAALLLRDQRLRAAMGAAAFQTVLKQYTFDRFRNSLHAHLQALLAPPQP